MCVDLSRDKMRSRWYMIRTPQLFFSLLVVLLFALSCTTRRASVHSTADKNSVVGKEFTLPTDTLPEGKEFIVADTLSNSSLPIDSLVRDQEPQINAVNGLLSAVDTVAMTEQDEPVDSIALPKVEERFTKVDSLTKESAMETAHSSVEPIVLESELNFSAKDSVVMLGQSQFYFFGESKVNYQRLNLDAHFMHINTENSQIYAQYVLDEMGHPKAYPTFAEGEQKFESETMLYNFRTQKGYITGVLTQQGEGFLTSEEAMRMPDNTMFIKGGRYTTCDNHDNPHFYIRLTKAKVVPDKNIVSGPVYMVMAGVPLYIIGLPFGFFPFNEKRTSGIIMPSYGDELERGFYLRGGGFYYAINDYVDLTVRGDIYTLGSWGVSASSNYIRRYKYSGHVEASYVSTVRGDRKIPNDFSQSRDFSLNWSHKQDEKVDPLRNFSASVNFSTSSYNHNSTKNMYDPDRRAQNTKGSSVSYSRRFTEIPLNITAALNIDQRSADSTLSVSLPNLSISLGTIYPFKKKKRVGKERWYEKISLSYSGSFRNSITTKENLFFKSNLLKDWKNGMQHRIPISASFDLFNYIKITPSINYSARWYTNKSGRVWNDETQGFMDADTTYGFYHVHDYSASLSASTTLYGFYRPWSIFGDKVQMIRHRFTPSISLSYVPDFGREYLGYYKTAHGVDKDGNTKEEIYSPFRNGMFGVPGRNKSGSVNFSFSNNLEMKLRNAADTVGDGFKKISLIDQLDWNISYNMMADSLKWSNINASIALRLSDQFVLRLSGDFDTYLYDCIVSPTGQVSVFQVDKLRILNGKGLGRLTRTGTGFSYTFNNQTGQKIKSFFNKLLNRNKEGDEDSASNDSSDMGDTMSLGNPFGTNSMDNQGDGGFGSSSKGVTRGRKGGDMDDKDSDGYVKWNFPWSFSFNYSMGLGYDYSNFDVTKKEYPYKLTHNLSFRGDIKPTKNWAFLFDANYNFDLKKVTNMTISISRDLHCWQLTGNIIPIGPYKSYSVTIGIKSSLLKDIKYQQSNLSTGSSSGAQWY